jgi:hypothetical protein
MIQFKNADEALRYALNEIAQLRADLTKVNGQLITQANVIGMLIWYLDTLGVAPKAPMAKLLDDHVRIPEGIREDDPMILGMLAAYSDITRAIETSEKPSWIPAIIDGGRADDGPTP